MPGPGCRAGRSIPTGPNSRLLKKALRLVERDDISTVLAVNAVTITDNYWFQEERSPLTWEDVRFKENLFDNLALRGDPWVSQRPVAHAGADQHGQLREMLAAD